MVKVILEYNSDITHGQLTTDLAQYCNENSIELVWEKIRFKSLHSTEQHIYTHEAMEIILNNAINDELPWSISSVWRVWTN